MCVLPCSFRFSSGLLAIPSLVVLSYLQSKPRSVRSPVIQDHDPSGPPKLKTLQTYTVSLSRGIAWLCSLMSFVEPSLVMCTNICFTLSSGLGIGSFCGLGNFFGFLWLLLLAGLLVVGDIHLQYNQGSHSRNSTSIHGINRHSANGCTCRST